MKRVGKSGPEKENLRHSQQRHKIANNKLCILIDFIHSAIYWCFNMKRLSKRQFPVHLPVPIERPVPETSEDPHT